MKPSTALLEACSKTPEGGKWLEVYHTSDEKFQHLMNVISNATSEQLEWMEDILELEQERRMAQKEACK